MTTKEQRSTEKKEEGNFEFLDRVYGGEGPSTEIENERRRPGFRLNKEGQREKRIRTIHRNHIISTRHMVLNE